jgi:serine/threonine-protein kinase HipA
MSTRASIEIFRDHHWVPAATLAVQDDGAGRCVFDYATEYIFSKDPQPVSLTQPVGFIDAAYTAPVGGGLDKRDFRLPAFLYDLLPQGKGRSFLVKRLGLSDSDELALPLLLAGAFNPIGALRIDHAVRFFQNEQRSATGGQRDWSQGVTLKDMTDKSDAFLQQLALHAMLASGTTGVQGVAPKYLMTQDAAGLWYPDMGLPDQQAKAHWLIKLPRGRADDDRLVLRNEAAYLRVARACGLRTHEDPMLVNEMLFVRRFDRVVNAQGLHRLHQESLASLAGHRGFGVPTSHNELLQALRRYVTQPLRETIEYLKRDVLNQALRNPDNHARNTAVQRTLDGTIALTPVFDFAPMYKDPEIVPRAVHWKSATGQHLSEWTDILPTLDLPDAEKAECAGQLLGFADTVANLPDIAVECGVEPTVIQDCSASIALAADRLLRLNILAGR